MVIPSLAGDWDERYGAVETGVFGDAPNEFLAGMASRYLPTTGRVLSYGEGDGRNAAFVTTRGLSVVGVDLSAVGLAKATRRIGSPFTGVVGDVATAELPPGEPFVAVLSIFCHVPPPVRRAMYLRAASVLAPGGAIFIESYHPDQLKRDTGGPKDAIMLVYLSDLDADFAGTGLIRRVGCEVVRPVIEGHLHNGDACVTQAVFQKES
jgi:hypothetical protein